MIQLNLNGKNYSLASGKKIYFKQVGGGSTASNFQQVKNVYYGEGSNPKYRKVYQYDNKPPVIELTSPVVSQKINGSTITATITGKVYDKDSYIQSFTVNGTAVTPNSDSTFATNVTISNNATIKLKAIDGAGYSSERSITFTKKSQDVYRTVSHSSGLTGYNSKYGTSLAPYCDHCGAAWGSPGHCTWTEQEYAGTNYWYEVTSIT